MALTREEAAAVRVFEAYRLALAEMNALPGYFPRTLWDCGRKVFGYFMSAGNACIVSGIDPEEYIRLAFSMNTRNLNCILPQDIVGAGAVMDAVRHQAQCGLRVENEWVAMSKQLALRAGRMVKSIPGSTDQAELDAAARQDLALDPMQPFTAWFRVLHGNRLDEDVLQVYGAEAWRELSGDAALRRFLRKTCGYAVSELEKRFGLFIDSYS
jgi:hypothetical protein